MEPKSIEMYHGLDDANYRVRCHDCLGAGEVQTFAGLSLGRNTFERGRCGRCRGTGWTQDRTSRALWKAKLFDEVAARYCDRNHDFDALAESDRLLREARWVAPELEADLDVRTVWAAVRTDSAPWTIEGRGYLSRPDFPG